MEHHGFHFVFAPHGVPKLSWETERQRSRLSKTETKRKTQSTPKHHVSVIQYASKSEFLYRTLLEIITSVHKFQINEEIVYSVSKQSHISPYISNQRRIRLLFLEASKAQTLRSSLITHLNHGEQRFVSSRRCTSIHLFATWVC
jgi:hypothetical protein